VADPAHGGQVLIVPTQFPALPALLRQPKKFLGTRNRIGDHVLSVEDDWKGKIAGPVGRIEVCGGLKSATSQIGWPTQD